MKPVRRLLALLALACGGAFAQSYPVRPVTLVVPGNASRERLDRIRAHGAELLLTDPIEGYDDYRVRTAARELLKKWNAAAQAAAAAPKTLSLLDRLLMGSSLTPASERLVTRTPTGRPSGSGNGSWSRTHSLISRGNAASRLNWRRSTRSFLG